MNSSPKSVETAFGIAQSPAKPSPGKNGPLLVGPCSEIPEGGVKIVRHGSLSIGIFRVRGEYHALRNQCPHQGAPLCLGKLHTTHAPSGVGVFDPVLEGRVLRCPWHGWEFDIATGKGLYDAKGRVKTYATRVDSKGILWIDL